VVCDLLAFLRSENLFSSSFVSFKKWLSIFIFRAETHNHMKW